MTSSPALHEVASQTDGSADFDFLTGRWVVRHRRLQKRLEGNTAWNAFDGTCDMRPVLGGFGNVDDNVIELPGGFYRAASIRAFNAVTAEWSIWWLDSRNADIDKPVRGRFENGVGTFFGEDVFKGRPILVRFLWSRTAEASPCWEQAFSADKGETWETNWIMDFERPR